MEPLVLQPINAMPAPTWHRLSVNGSSLSIPDHYATTSTYTLHCASDLVGTEDAFTQAMNDLQLRTFGTPQAACSPEMAQAQIQARQTSPESDETASLLDQCALSSFQAYAQAVETTQSVHYAFETGMGKAATNYLRSVAGVPTVITTTPNSPDNEAAVLIPTQAETVNAVALDIIVADNSTCHASLVFDNPSMSDDAIVGASTRIFVGRGATLRLTITQTASQNVIVLDDLGIVLDEQATLIIEQNIFGAATAFEGCAIDLRGDQAQASLKTHFIGQQHQKRDFNFLMRHHGKNTVSTMQANGVLTHQSLKTLRGTIDFVQGCHGSEASELETVLLTDKTAINRSVPVILCGEDDVVGNHGATIGSMQPEQLFYLESRGISADQANTMMLQAVVESAYLEASDAYSRSAIEAFGKTHFATFEDILA